MIIDDVIETQIVPKLNTIDYLSVLDGFLIHYVNDLLAGKNGLSFPCIAVQPNSETIDAKPDLTSGSVNRTLSLVGAVSTNDKSSVRRQLDELAQQVRKVLAVDKFNKSKSDRPIKYISCTYDLPDSQDSYAFFEMKIEITINETWIEK